MKDKEALKLGESFERLRANPDYLNLRKFIEEEVQKISDQLLQPKVPQGVGGLYTPGTPAPAPISLEEIALSVTYLQGQLIGLASPESHMEIIIKRKRELEEQKEKKLE